MIASTNKTTLTKGKQSTPLQRRMSTREVRTHFGTLIGQVHDTRTLQSFLSSEEVQPERSLFGTFPELRALDQDDDLIDDIKQLWRDSLKSVDCRYCA